MPPHPLNYFEIQNCYQNESKFRNLVVFIQEIIYRTYVINLDGFKSNWNSCDKFVCECWKFNILWELKIFRKKFKKIIGNKNIIANIHRIQAYDSIMCGNFCIGYIDFMLNGNKLC